MTMPFDAWRAAIERCRSYLDAPTGDNPKEWRDGRVVVQDDAALRSLLEALPLLQACAEQVADGGVVSDDPGAWCMFCDAEARWTSEMQHESDCLTVRAARLVRQATHDA